MTPQLPSQVGFYLLPPEQKSKRRKHPRPLVPRHWKSQSHLDVITEASEESRNSTPNTSSTLTQLLSPTLLRKNTALPGLMFDRPTRHPSLDDLRGYGRNMSYDQDVGSRQESQDSVEEEEVPQPSHPQPNTSKRIPVPPPPPVEYPDYRFGYKGKSGGPHFEVESRGLRMRRYSMLLSRPGLRRQFDRFARYGEPRATGDFITLSQTEKWFKQAGVIDNWNVTTTDTAIYFRKISKGSKWVDYDNWRIFLEELAWRKRLNLDYLIDRLELTGKPPVTNSSVQTKNGKNALIKPKGT
eukprot:TCALIF_00184-PA protein Name:"Similar to CG45057 TPPP family protein CG45057 (Drosophila melanogaster)" AED:0.09 eAED:0.10 QI:78/0.8/0.83/1/0.8/0.83/6/149/296